MFLTPPPMCCHYTACRVRRTEAKLQTSTTSSTTSASHSNRSSGGRRAWTPQPHACSKLTLPSCLHLILQISSWKRGQCCHLILTTLLTVCLQFSSLSICLCSFTALIRNRIGLVQALWQKLNLGCFHTLATLSQLCAHMDCMQKDKEAI